MNKYNTVFGQMLELLSRSHSEKLVKEHKTFYPQKENRDIYRRAYESWKAVYPPYLQLSDNKITRYMWCAPGL